MTPSLADGPGADPLDVEAEGEAAERVTGADLLVSVPPEQFERLPRPNAEEIQAALDRGYAEAFRR